MKKIFFVLMGIILMLIDLSIGNNISFINIYINLTYIYLVVLILKTDLVTSLINVSALSIIHDILIEKYFGTSLLFFVFIIYFIRKIIEIFDSSRIFVIISIFCISSFLLCLYSYIIDNIFYYSVGINVFFSDVLIYMILNSFLGLVFYKITSRHIDNINKNWW